MTNSDNIDGQDRSPGVDDGVDLAATQTWLRRTSELSARFLLVVAAAALVVWALVQIRIVVLPVIVALFVSTALMPLSDRLRRLGLPPALAALLTVVLALATLFGIGGYIGSAAADEFGSLSSDLSDAIDEIEDWFVDGPLGIDRSRVEDTRDQIASSFDGESSSVTDGALQAGALAIEVIAGLAVSIVLVFFVLKDGHRAGDAVARIVGRERGDDLRDLGADVWSTMGGYLRGVAITGVADALLIGLGLALLGVPLVAPLMLLTFFGAFIPLVGATAAGVVAVLVALVSNGPGTALAVGALVLVVQQVEGDVLAPLVLGRAVRLHPVTVLLSLTAGGVLAGIVGAFLAVPTAAVVKTIVVHYRPEVDAARAETDQSETGR